MFTKFVCLQKKGLNCKTNQYCSIKLNKHLKQFNAKQPQYAVFYILNNLLSNFLRRCFKFFWYLNLLICLKNVIIYEVFFYPLAATWPGRKYFIYGILQYSRSKSLRKVLGICFLCKRIYKILGVGVQSRGLCL